MKRLLILLFTLVLLITVVLSLASCGYILGKVGLKYEFAPDENVCGVIGVSIESREIVIPSTYRGMSVVAVGSEAFKDCTKIRSVYIPDSVTYIGRGAFSGCSNLKSIEIPDSVTSLGESAFEDCDSLTSVVIGDGITSIHMYTFSGCDSLTSVVIGDSVTYIDGYAFSGCSNLIVKDNGIHYIDKWVVGCDSDITSAVLRDNTVGIAGFAFHDCKSLTSIVIPESVTTIGNDNGTGVSFYGCYKLVEVYNLSDLTITAGSYDNGDVGLYALNVYTDTEGEKKTFETEDGFIFYEDGDIRYLLGYKGNETDITLPEDCNGKSYEIYEYAFYENDKLTSVVIPDSVTSIADDAFQGCTSLTSVVIGDSVTTIGDSVFERCDSLTSIVIPDSVTRIGDYAFKNCDKLVEVYNLSDLTITAGSYGNGRIGVHALNVYTDTEGEKKTFETEDGFIFYEDGHIRYLIGYKGNETEITLPEDCNGKSYEIYKYAFRKNNKLTSVVIPDSVTSIADDAFQGCTSLTSVAIGDSVTTIGESAFEDCTSLTSVVIGNSVTSIGISAFVDCDSLTSVVIGDSVTTIGGSAFYSCDSLTSINIPESVTSIGFGAFDNCYDLTSVYYLGNATEWDAISIGPFNLELTYTTRYYYSESEPTVTGNYWHYDEDGNVAVWQ